MSSLSQEDLGAGRAGSDVALATARPGLPADAKSLTPNSMTLERAAVPIESMVVPAATQVPLVAERPELIPFDFESREAERAESLSPLSVPTTAVEGAAVGDVTLMQSRPLLESPIEAAPMTQPERVPASEPRLIDTSREPGIPDEAQCASVARRLRQLAEVAALESHEVRREHSSIEAVVASDIPSEPRKGRYGSGRAPVRNLRLLVWSTAALVGLVISYWLVHSGNKPRPDAHSTVSLSAPLSLTGSSKSQADAVVVNAAVRPMRPIDTPARANKIGVEPGSTVQAESFADAFAKHAASANSNWAEVMKRSKSTDAQSTNRSNQPAASASTDNPLGVLDQLEKARKAKKQTSGQP